MLVKDKKTGKIETVIETTGTSYLITLTKLSSKGINCTNWFTEDGFVRRFEKIN
jgi:hypothetical protein